MTPNAPPPATLSEGIRRSARGLGFEAVGIAALRPSDHAAFYRAWIGRGLHGSMGYLAREDSVEARLDPGIRWPELRSAIVVAHHYGTSGAPSSADPGETGPVADEVPDPTTPPGSSTLGDPAAGVIARYARGRDYHRVVKRKLLALLRWIEGETGRELPDARGYVDTGPVLERELAQRAGLGWQGRNTMLIDPRRGSWFFLGVLFLPFDLEYDDPFTADRCGSCTACLDACPTGALLGRDEGGAPVMDARLCISYLTIENRGPIPEDLRPRIGNRIYGCDICQEVCPWNSPKLAQATGERDYLPRVPGASGGTGPSGSPYPAPGGHQRGDPGPATDGPSLIALMRMTREEWDRWTRGSAIRRAGYAGLRRNVAVALGNWLASGGPRHDAVAVLHEALKDSEPLVREHAAWALSQV